MAAAVGGRTASVDTDHDTNGTLPLVVRRLARSAPPTASGGDGLVAVAAAAADAAAGAGATVDTDHDTNSTLPLLV